MIRPFVSSRTPLLLALLLIPARTVDAAAPVHDRGQGPPVAGMILVTSGDTISHLGDVQPHLLKGNRKDRLPFTRVGYKYHYWGVFWLDLWTWGGEYCGYDGKMFWPVTPAQAAALLGVQESELGRPFNYKFPIGLLVLIGIVVLGVLGSVFAPKQTDPVAPFLSDPRYQQALEIYKARIDQAVNPIPPDGAITASPAPPSAPAVDPTVAAFDAGVHHLVAHGIAREEAERNFALMLTCQLLPRA